MTTPPVRSGIRFTFATPDAEPIQQSEYYRAAREMTELADRTGVLYVSVDEHHSTGFGWSPNPILEAGMLLVGTKRIRATAAAALAPLWDPVRMAEDLSVVDQMLQGRLTTHLGLGYRPVEYAAMGKSFRGRGKQLDAFLEILLKAFTGEPFERGGEMVSISPKPYTQPHPPIAIGGSVKASVERAVRFRLPLNLPDYLPELRDLYLERAAEEGFDNPEVTMVPKNMTGMTVLHEDPEKAWAELGHHLMWEAVNYGAWATDDMRSVMHVRNAISLEDVRSSGRYVVMTPDEAVTLLTTEGNTGITLHPFVGGMPLDEAWKSVHLLTDVVLPRVAAHRND